MNVQIKKYCTFKDLKKGIDIALNILNEIIVSTGPDVFICLNIYPDEADNYNYQVRLFSTDENTTYDQRLSVKDDCVIGNASLDLIFKNVDTDLLYSLQIEPGDNEEPYFIFENHKFK